MRDKRYSLTESDKKRLERQVERLEAAPPPAMLPSKFSAADAAPDGYWGLPPCETGIPAAERNLTTGELTPGMAMCCLYKYDSGYGKLMPVLQATGYPVKVLVKNFYTQVVNEHCQIWKQKDGTWANEQPRPVKIIVERENFLTNTYTSFCDGECVWIATAGLTWSGPVGGCRNTTTTTTTSTTSTTSTTTTLAPTTTLTPPCPSTLCRLRCVTTTPAGGTTVWPPVPGAVGRYQTIGTTCAPPCSCYGVNEPCFVLNGEIESRCVYANLTTTNTTTTGTTTTAGPIDATDACQLIENALGTPAPGQFRAAAKLDGLGGWQICQDCDPGYVPLRPLGGDEPEQPANYVGAVYHQSKCILSPCSRVTFTEEEIASGYWQDAVYAAYTYPELRQILAGIENYEDYIKIRDDKYLANWFLCSDCFPTTYEGPRRPLEAPGTWLFLENWRNNGLYWQAGLSNSVTVNSNGIYQYYSRCVPGYSCDSCKFSSPLTELGEFAIPLETSTPSPTTTRRPCSCEYPRTCPAIEGECIKSVCRPGGNYNQTPVQCPWTTPYPGRWCRDGFCGLCHCDAGNAPATTTTTTTTSAPCGGQCKYAVTEYWAYEQDRPLGGTPGPVRLVKKQRLQQFEDCTRGNPSLDVCQCKTPCTWPFTALYGIGYGWHDPPCTTPGPGTAWPSTTWPACGTVYTVPCDRIVYPTTTVNPCTGCVGTCLWQPCTVWEASSTLGRGYAKLGWCRGSANNVWYWEGYWNGNGCRAVGANGEPCNVDITPGPPGPGTSLYGSNCSILDPGRGWWDYWNSIYGGVEYTSWNRGCSCLIPPGTPGFCDITETACDAVWSACDCCHVNATSSPCGQDCSYRGDGYGGWTKIYDPCPSTCPCPVAPFWGSSDECDRTIFRCGSINLTTQAPPTTQTTQTTTTVGPGACCYPGGNCTFVDQRNCLTHLGGVWQGPGTTCTGATCIAYTTTSTTTEAPGACCHGPGANKTCTYSYRRWCNSVNGSFTPGTTCVGGNTFCNGTTTLSPLGSCCSFRGFCITGVRSDEAACVAGTWAQGDSNCGNGLRCSGRCCVTCPDGNKYCYDGFSAWDCYYAGVNSNGCTSDYTPYNPNNPVFCDSPSNPCTTTTTTTTTTAPSTAPPAP